MMNSLSQNKKIALSALGVFIISFVTMLFFLKSSAFTSMGDIEANILQSGGHESESKEDLNESGKGEEAEAGYRGYLHETDEPLVVTNSEGKIEYISEDFCELIDVRCSILNDTLLFNYINVADLTDFVVAHSKLMQSEDILEGLGPFRMLKGDREILVLFNAHAVKSEDGNVSHIIFSANDITKRVEEMNDGGAEKESVEKEKIDKVDEQENEKIKNEDAEDKKENSDDEINHSDEEIEKANDHNKEDWIKSFYPKIKNTKSKEDIKLLVGKISFRD